MILTVDEVKAMQGGELVDICGEDAEGQQHRLVCTVAFRDKHKFLTFRDHGQIRRCPIKEYPGKHYEKHPLPQAEERKTTKERRRRK